MAKNQDMEVSPRVGLLGELEVEMQLARNGWHPVRLDTAQMASNADLLAINREKRVSIQIKTTDAEKQHTAIRSGSGSVTPPATSERTSQFSIQSAARLSPMLLLRWATRGMRRNS
jgi:hypothetical protein